jgi:hypothetical protein
MSRIASIPFHRPRPTAEAVLALLKSTSFQLMTLLTCAFFLNREGIRVPAGNELVYLLYIFKAYHPHFMSADWTFIEPTAGHGFFNLAVGWLTLLMPLTWTAWVGRFACWTLGFVALLRVGRQFKIPSWCAWLGILFWLVERQALPTTQWTEWFIGSFEAKCPAYICLLFALDAALTERPAIAGLLAGLAFSFHSAVGLWGGAAIGWAIFAQCPMRKTIPFAACAILTALPGLISSLPLLTGAHAITLEQSRFLVTKAEPACIDPFAMSPGYVLVLGFMLGFAGLYCLQRGGRIAGMLLQFQLALAIFAMVGFIARALGRFDIVKLYPIRVFAVLTPLFFLWQLSWILLSVMKTRRKSGVTALFSAAMGLVLFLSFPSPVVQLAVTLASHVHSSLLPVDGSSTPDADLESTPDYRTACSWIDQHACEDDTVIAPPWRADTFYYARRPLVANWHAYRYDDMTVWRERIESLTGDLSTLDPRDAMVGDMDLSARAHYRSLSLDQLKSLRERYHAKWLITTSDYPFQQVFIAGPYKVFYLPA